MSDVATKQSELEQLKAMTVVVADTGDFESMRAYGPQDATTNPSLILKASRQEAYRPLVERAVADVSGGGLSGEALVSAIIDRVLVSFGQEILQIVPGRVSTEVDARLSFDVEGSVAKARQLIGLYEEAGVERERVLIKVASTWEGVRAAERLESEGIHCNLTLLFSLVQAAACAEAGVTLISPFVGRIYDWYKKEEGRDYEGADDPGVQSVTEIFHYFKARGYPTEVMGASFRNKGQILELAGCDLLTISPDLLEELAEGEGAVERKLDAGASKSETTADVAADEVSFRYALNDDAMATEKTAEGIRRFAADMVTLEEVVGEMVGV